METRRRITLVPLVGAIYFMVSGGPYGIEELAQKAGFGPAIVILLVTPLIWSLPTSLMVGELSAAIPAEGGYYIWVRRALGPFWGYQEAWLSMAASVFDMAIYPTLFVRYLARLWPAMGESPYPLLLSVMVIGICAAWNIAGARAVGDGSALMTGLLLAPFAVLALLAAAGFRLES
ncbi:MAG TPA: amino acid permease, partial [Polyangiaceae bacterium]|nr:amino acid permease [Polyangiaceae bacterium]